jgi:very-short-patch-repair endonuclease
MDEQRTALLNRKGIRVIRYWNNDVLENTDQVLEDIHAALNETTLGNGIH